MGRVRKQPEAGPDETGKKFPPRKRSIPYGFDFDLDEVWAPNNPHLKHLKNVNSSGEKNKNKIKASSYSGSQVQSSGFWGLFFEDKDFLFSHCGGEREAPRSLLGSPPSLTPRPRSSRTGTSRTRPSPSSATSLSSARTWRAWLSETPTVER